MDRRNRRRGQMSEAFSTTVFLTLSGGLQDAYSYCVRDKVFANAQTGNIVLMSQHIFSGDWTGVLRYLIPLLSFGLGVFTAEMVRRRYRDFEVLHWRQLILLTEITLLFLVGFLPHRLDALANAVVSFACAMQVQTFRKVRGSAYASTMCIGNLRSGVDQLCSYLQDHERAALRKAVRYFTVILVFAFGAGIGGMAAAHLGAASIWVSCAFLAVSFLLMFLKEELEE